MAYTACKYQSGDILLVGRESAGVPEEVFAAADFAVRIPMRPEARSLNVAVAAAMVMGEALRQLEGVAG
jgi:tRNA (cytidine/uridine-2'-O-)-methyltransferase